MKLDCRISGKYLLCNITVNRNIYDPVLCFSGMAPMNVKSGGKYLRSTGSYTEIQLPPLNSENKHNIVLIYEDGISPANRAWKPQGAYLRHDEGISLLETGVKGFIAKPQPKTLPNTLSSETLKLIPQPTQWTADGQSVYVDNFDCSDPAFAAVAALAKRQQMGKFISSAGFPVHVVEASMPADAYRIEIQPDRVTVNSATYGGTFYAAITLLTLLRADNHQIPCGTLIDSPRFSWRGQHLDCARHFYRPSTILNYLDLMALLKLNRFHWHFSDDESFRIEVECYPELWQKTALRGEGHLLPGLFSNSVEAGGSYSKADVKNIIEHAQALNIEVMPEIEVPAHALAMTRLFPAVLDPNDTGAEKSVQGYEKNVLNPAMPKTWELLEALVKEIATLFPYQYMHLGCDELPENTWLGSPAAQTLMVQHNLKNTQDLCAWTMRKLANLVHREGKTPAAWQEAGLGSQGGIGHDALLFSWTGSDPGYDAARAGYDVVLAPAQHVYLDMAHTNAVNDWGANWAAYVSLADTTAWDPIPIDEPELEHRIVGVQGCFWSEFTSEDQQMWPMVMPRLLGVSVQCWQVGNMDSATLENLADVYMTSIWKMPETCVEQNE